MVASRIFRMSCGGSSISASRCIRPTSPSTRATNCEQFAQPAACTANSEASFGASLPSRYSLRRSSEILQFQSIELLQITSAAKAALPCYKPNVAVETATYKPPTNSCWPHAHLFQNSRQLDAPPVDSRFYGAFGHCEYGLNLVVFQPLQISQDYRLAQFGRKPCESALQLHAQLRGFGEPIGRSRLRVLFLEHRHRIVDRIRHAIVAGSPVMIDQQVARHAGEPRRKRSIRRPITRERAIDAQKNLLAQILRVGCVPRNPVT